MEKSRNPSEMRPEILREVAVLLFIEEVFHTIKRRNKIADKESQVILKSASNVDAFMGCFRFEDIPSRVKRFAQR